MEGYVNRTGTYEFEEFGPVRVTVRAGARTMRVRWKGQQLHAFAPSGVEASRLLAFLRQVAPKLEQTRPRDMHAIGQTWQFPCFSVEMRRAQPSAPRRSITFGREGENHVVMYVGANIDLSSPSGCDVASRAFCHVSQSYGPRLIDRAREVAAALGVAPASWEVSRGHRVLGHCDRHRVIALSHVLTMYPPELRDYVICHELTHLSQMNHSQAFHALCDSYCRRLLGRPEAELSRLTAAFRPPIIR